MFVSGGTKGIGLAIVKGFLGEGCKVACIARNEDLIARIASELKQEYLEENLLCLKADATQEEELVSSLKKVTERFGTIDILVSNIGNGKSVPDPLPAKDQFRTVWETNFTSAENLVRVGMNYLTPKDSSILFISSIAGVEAIGAPTDYSVAKSALIALSKNLARKLAPNIRVNCIAPGNIFFPGGSWEEKVKQDPDRVNLIIQTTVPMKRFGTPEEIADAVLFLSSERATFITGSCLIVDGGQTVSLH